jgi:hypothetical protein
MRFIVFCAAATVLWLGGCEPEVGQPCLPSDVSEANVKVAKGTNDLVRNVAFDNCTQALCLSTDGSRPYCTKECVADSECTDAGEGFSCLAVISFGELACADYIDCESVDEGQTCDCVTTTNPRKYCAAKPEVIDARDVEYGRAP